MIERAADIAVRIRDKSDLPVSEEAVVGGADVLVTGDRDLLDIAGKAPLPVLTPREYWQRLRLGSRPRK